MTDDSVTVSVLREIRDEVRATRVDLTDMLRQTNSRLDQTNSRLDHVESAIVDLAEQQSFVVRWLKAGTTRDRRLEESVLKLRRRVDAVEARLPPTKE